MVAAASADFLDAEPPAADALGAAVAALEKDVVFGRLHPRERLVEDDLMARFDVKRQREALAALDRIDLIERRRTWAPWCAPSPPRKCRSCTNCAACSKSRPRARSPCRSPSLDHGRQQQRHAAVAEGNARLFRINWPTRAAPGGQRHAHKAITEYARQTPPSAPPPGLGQLRARTPEHWQMIEALRAQDRDALVRLAPSTCCPRAMRI